MDDDVRNWLKSYGLQNYAQTFEDYGWEKLDDIFDIDEDNLRLCIHKPGHRKRFYLAVQETIATGAHHSIKIDEKSNGDDTAGDDHDAKIDAVANWLQRNGLDRYISNFQDEGWDMLEVIINMDVQDVQKCIDRPGHRKKFQIALKQQNFTFVNQTSSDPSDTVMPGIVNEEHIVKTWLTKHNLDQYLDNLNDKGWDTMEVLCELGKNEEDLIGCIDKPGHRKRFQRAINSENSKESTDETIHSDMLEEMTASQKSTHREIENDSIAHLQKDSQNMNSDLTIVHEAAATPKTEFERVKEFHCSEKANSDAGNVISITEVDETVERQAIGRYDRPSLGQTTLKEETVQFGLSFEENESQSATDSSLLERDVFSGDWTEDDNEETDISDNYEVKTMDLETKGIKRTYSLPPIPSTLFIQKANLAVGGHIVNYSNGGTFSKDAKKKYRDNFRKQMKTALEVSKEKDSLFVETKAYLELEERVKKSHWGVVTGIPGDGKTSMAVHLSLKYNKEGYEHLELHFARDWKDWVDGSSGSDNGKKQFILIDDIFGRMSIDERKVSEWSSIIDLMQKVVQQRQGKLKVVCTSRKYVFEDVKTKLAQYASFQDPIDMTQKEFGLTKDNKSHIWNAYAKKVKLKIPMPQTFSDDGKEEGSPHGFPHCVDLYFGSTSLQNEEDFFDNPMQCICRELDNFKDHDKIKYFALLLVLFTDNKLTDVCIENMAVDHPGFKIRASAAGLTSCPTSTGLRQELEKLSGTYVTELMGCYSISHDSIRENLAFVFIKQNPVYAIQNMDFDYLTDHTRCPGQTISDNPHSRLMYTLNPQFNELLVNRMLYEIKRGNVVAVCAHQAWDDKAFVEDFIQCLLRMSEENYAEQHGCSRIADVFNTKDSSTSYIFDFSLFDALRFFGHKEAVKQILQSQLGTLLDESQGQIETPKEINFEKPLSLLLHGIMNKIGASPELREFQIHSAISMEQLDTVCAYIAGEKFRCYIFGSHSEGTRIITHIPKRDCDVNYLFCLKNSEVVQSLSEIKTDQNTQYLLAVTDAITRPGYVKLQIVNDGVPQTKSNMENTPVSVDTAIDHEDRIVLCKRRPDKIHVDEVKGLIATTDIVTAKANIEEETATQPFVTGTDYEIYHSYRCRSWPKIATKWISRNRHYNWPSRSVIEQIRSLGVFLVPVGSQGSFEKILEWKILFLLQERMLISTLNDTQYKCYIILKMINNDIISKRFDEPVLVTYHLKTCLFYAIENTPKSLWQRERLLDCLQVCLKSILQCATEGNCPNYFIPQDNLFYRRVRGEVQTKLTNVLTDLLACHVSFWYLPMITCGNFGPRLVQEICGKTDTVKNDQDLVPSPVRLYLKLVKFLSLVKMRILFKCYSIDTEECARIHFEKAVKPLLEVDEIIDHTKEQTEKAFALVLPYVELSLMSVLVARQMEISNDNDEILPLLMSQKWKQIGLSIPSRLKQAMFFHMCGQIDVSLRVLRSIEHSMNPFMISVCGCQYHHTIVDDAIKEKIKGMSEKEFRKNMCVSCIAFLPTERHVIPGVLGYEMKRTKVTPQSNPTSTFHFWYDWAVVDGKVLLYLILYLNYRTIRLRSNSTLFAEVSEDIRRKARNVIKELQNIINEDPNLGHKETGLNILGWIYRQEGNEDEAKRCFRESLEIQPEYNAANLHMEEPMYVRF